MESELHDHAQSNTQVANVDVSGGQRRGWSNALGPLVGFGAILGAAGFIGMVNPSNSGVYPLCPTQALFGIDCPGCGGLRCVHELMNGNLGAAADQNLFVLLVLPLVLIAIAAAIARKFLGSPNEPPALFSNTLGSLRTVGISINQRALMWTLLIGLIAFTVARNFPFVPFLGSGIG
ncbi:MAG: DUF2752 domain-containing protein [Candidatus Nanopelagicales bacterium]